jgi:hypothetical protein
VRQEHKETLASLRSMVKTIEKDLRAQRDRIERFMSREHHWDYPDWKQRYIEHPLIAQLACRLIWHFQTGEESRLGIWQDGEFIDAEGKPLQHLDGSTKVRLWHPIGFPLEQIRAWRVWLENNAVVQPFKQAHREVYILTDAELETNTYSNRFAAHILKQHQFAALCRQRGWDYSLHGSFDGGTWAKKSLPEWDVQAEFTVEGIQQETLMSAAWICLYISTDQVRFLRDGNPLPLSEVPAIAFAELMRDVDLFVGVASVGNDPDWQDRGEMPGFDRYWHSYSFGDLSATAQTRREVLERLLPRLKIRDQAYIEGRFLVVKGQLRIYKIHLGSSNILMEPNDQYLCIIPDRSSANPAQYPVFLPFDGDQTLAVILSKAFMLAEDTKIKDTSITSQIKQ